MTSPMSRDGIFRDAVPSRYVAIRQPNPKIGLNFKTLGVPADGASPRHAINLPRFEQNAFFAQPAHTTQNRQSITPSLEFATCLTLPASYFKRVHALTAR